MKDKNSQLLDKVMESLDSLPIDRGRTIHEGHYAPLMKVIESYAATREAEGRIDELKRLQKQAKIPYQVYWGFPRVVTIKELNNRLRALTDTQGESKPGDYDYDTYDNRLKRGECPFGRKDDNPCLLLACPVHGDTQGGE